MSEPMSSGEIEDVLSSIRRLVSEDLRPAARPPAPEAAATRAPADKLLLTPALRVVREDAPSPEDGAGVTDTPAASRPEQEDISETGEAAFHSVRGGAAADAVAAVGAAMARDAVQDEAGDEADGHWGEAPFRHVEEGEDVAPVQPADATDLWEALPEAATSDRVEEAEDWVPELDDPASDAEIYWQADEAAVAAAPEPPPSDAADWADAAEAEVLRELSEEAAEETVFERMEAADAVYDEELLRDLVRDIIREELQGALGERITRNVRKLVRAEIARALAVRDFE